MKSVCYLDYNATTPVDKQVLEAMLPWFREKFGNAASSTHSFGWEAAEAVKIAREQIALLLHSEPEEILFTSGSTEGINLALKGVAEAYASKGNHIVTVATEHKAVLDTCAYLEKQGKQITILPVNEEGFIDMQNLENAITDKTILVSVMLANNETGLIQPMKEIAERVHRKGCMLMSDATQAIGKIEVNVNEMGIDLMCLSAHKFYGPKGVGALFFRRKNPRVALKPLLHGGGHERGLRCGTLNVPGIVGMGTAAELASAEIISDSTRIGKLRDQLENQLREKTGAVVNGNIQQRLANTSNLSFPGLRAEMLLKNISRLAVSTGSACTSAKMEPSHVLNAMGFDEARCFASIRFSLGRLTTNEEVDFALDQISTAISKLKSQT